MLSLSCIMRSSMRKTASFNVKSFSAAAATHSMPETTRSEAKATDLLSALKPKEIVSHLNAFIVGQDDAKRAVAIALRNRWRRHQLGQDFRNEVIPKNILMIGPTGCGKTEIARRIAKLSQAPFIKVEATKFTEVGFHGKDVDQIIKDLVDISIGMTKKRIREEVISEVATVVEDRILAALLGPDANPAEKETYRTLLRNGDLDNRKIDIEIPFKQSEKGGRNAGHGGEMSDNPAIILLGDMVRSSGGRGSKKGDRRNIKVSEAKPLLTEHEVDKVVDNRDVEKEAIIAVEQSGIVFIDEIDKLVSSSDYRGADASSEGVQRDLLPLIEGSCIQTKHGNVNTDFILFIASGAFHSSKPSDLLAELQGRLPIRVTLKGLTEGDLLKILTEPVTNLIRQQVEMLKSEKVDLEFTPAAIAEIARVAFVMNKTVENIGARRLHTIIERVIEEISFDASEKEGEKVQITEEYVKQRVSNLLINSDLRKYIL